MQKPLILTILISICSQAWAAGNLKDLCQGKMDVDETAIVVIDSGFCNQYLKLETEDMLSETLALFNTIPQIPATDCRPPLRAKQEKWKLRFYASHSYTTYFNSDMKIQSSRYNVEIKDYEWAERSSREFFTLSEWKKPGSNPLQMIDEPSNTFTVSLEKNGHEFFLSAFHPKFLQASDQVKYVKGSIDGTLVDGYVPLNKPHDGWNQTPGESELVRNANTHKQMTFEIGYGYRFKLFDTEVGSMSFIPSVGVGVMGGANRSTVIKPNEWFEFDEYNDSQYIQGFGGSVTNRIEFNTKKEKVGIFYENKLGFYHQNHGFLDGKQTYNLGFMGNSMGIKLMIYNPSRKKKKK
jgi:hypothetical protein